MLTPAPLTYSAEGSTSPLALFLRAVAVGVSAASDAADEALPLLGVVIENCHVVATWC